MYFFCLFTGDLQKRYLADGFVEVEQREVHSRAARDGRDARALFVVRRGALFASSFGRRRQRRRRRRRRFRRGRRFRRRRFGRRGRRPGHVGDGPVDVDVAAVVGNVAQVGQLIEALDQRLDDLVDGDGVLQQALAVDDGLVMAAFV